MTMNRMSVARTKLPTNMTRQSRGNASLLMVHALVTLTMLVMFSTAVVAGPRPANVLSEVPSDSWRWFEVEVLIFKHTRTDALQEQFPLPVQPIQNAGYTDLLSAEIAPKVADLSYYLPVCELKPNGAPIAVDDIAFEPCKLPGEHDLVPLSINPTPVSPLAHIKQTPVVLDGPGGDIETAKQAFLMPATSHEFTAFREQLEARGQAQTLIHFNYKQPVFRKSDDYKMRVFAGHNFSADYNYFGFQLPTAATEQHNEADLLQQRDALDRIQRLLQLIDDNQVQFKIGDDPTQALLPLRPNNWPAGLPDQVWELDGLLHIYLVGNYLHIDSDFNLREETQAKEATPDMAAQAELALTGSRKEQAFLRAYPFAQVRRVISHETHYFDHPKMGVVVQIRRTDLSARR